MQVNLDCNRPNPQFGNFKRPEGIVKKVFIGYINPHSQNVCKRGFYQFEKEASKSRYFDLEFNPCTWAIEIKNKKDNKAVELIEFAEKKTGFDIPGEINYPGKKLFARIFNPKRFLPKNVYLSGQRLKELEKQMSKKMQRAKDFFDE